MKTWLIALASIAVLSIPSIGKAETGRPGPYVSVFIGASMLNDTTVYSYDYYYGGAYRDNVEFDPGVYTGFTGGYDFGFVRLEGELSYRYNEIKSVEGFQSVDGDIGSFATMFNVFFDLHNSSPVTPYLGGGIGFASLYLSDTYGWGPYGNVPLYAEGYDTVFAYQFGAGVDIALNRNMSLDVGYRYFKTDDAHIDPEYSYYPITSSFEHESHNIMVGFKFKF
jgi:opacity protein-like surface antigen